jgi:hypothetical protein
MARGKKTTGFVLTLGCLIILLTAHPAPGAWPFWICLTILASFFWTDSFAIVSSKLKYASQILIGSLMVGFYILFLSTCGIAIRTCMFLTLLLTAWVISTLVPNSRKPKKLGHILALTWGILTLFSVYQHQFTVRSNLPLPPGKDGVDLANHSLEIKDLQMLNASHLKWLGLRNTNVNDKLLLELKASTFLEVLDLRTTAITDTGILHRKHFPNLRILIPVLLCLEKPLKKVFKS